MRNKEEIIKNMISFIEEKEKQFQNDTLVSDVQVKNDIVKATLDELERVIDDEN